MAMVLWLVMADMATVMVLWLRFYGYGYCIMTTVMLLWLVMVIWLWYYGYGYRRYGYGYGRYGYGYGILLFSRRCSPTWITNRILNKYNINKCPEIRHDAQIQQIVCNGVIKYSCPLASPHCLSARPPFWIQDVQSGGSSGPTGISRLFVCTANQPSDRVMRKWMYANAKICIERNGWQGNSSNSTISQTNGLHDRLS